MKCYLALYIGQSILFICSLDASLKIISPCRVHKLVRINEALLSIAKGRGFITQRKQGRHCALIDFTLVNNVDRRCSNAGKSKATIYKCILR